MVRGGYKSWVYRFMLDAWICSELLAISVVGTLIWSQIGKKGGIELECWLKISGSIPNSVEV